MKKNVASQVVLGQLVALADGSAVTSGTTTVYVTGDAGTQALGSVGSGVCTHEGNGLWSYAPATAETNYTNVVFTFINSLAVNCSVQIYTTFPQTGDNYARLGAPAGASVSADIAAAKVDTAAILVDTADMQPKLGTPAGASMSADTAAVKADTAAILVDTADMQPKLGTPSTDISADIAAVFADTADMQPKLGTPVGASISADIAAVLLDTAEIGTAGAGLTAVQADVIKVGGSAAIATKLKRVLQGNVTGTIGAASTATVLVTSALDPAAASVNQYQGRILIFADDTTTVNLRGQATDITASTTGGILTVSELSDAPVSGDSFTVT